SISSSAASNPAVEVSHVPAAVADVEVVVNVPGVAANNATDAMAATRAANRTNAMGSLSAIMWGGGCPWPGDSVGLSLQWGKQGFPYPATLLPRNYSCSRR